MNKGTRSLSRCSFAEAADSRGKTGNSFFHSRSQDSWPRRIFVCHLQTRESSAAINFVILEQNRPTDRPSTRKPARPFFILMLAPATPSPLPPFVRPWPAFSFQASLSSARVRRVAAGSTVLSLRDSENSWLASENAGLTEWRQRSRTNRSVKLTRTPA